MLGTSSIRPGIENTMLSKKIQSLSEEFRKGNDIVRETLAHRKSSHNCGTYCKVRYRVLSEDVTRQFNQLKKVREGFPEEMIIKPRSEA